MKPEKRKLESWLGVYDNVSFTYEVNSIEELQKVRSMIPVAVPIGNNHSYNRSALPDCAVKLGPAFRYVYRSRPGVYVVGGSATIEDVMTTMLKHGEQLEASGNHRAQTFVGAVMGGTHGFGPNATMADSVISSQRVGDFVHRMNVKAVPLRSYRIQHCVCPLSDESLRSHSMNARTFAILPYSGVDPVCVVSDYKVVSLHDAAVRYDGFDIRFNHQNQRSWWPIRLISRIQNRFPAVHRRAQKAINFAKMKTWNSVTRAGDIDSMYHPWPEADVGPVRGSRWLYWSQRPTYQWHNIALGFNPEDVEEVVQRARATVGDKLAGFIGARELTTTSQWEPAVNFLKPRTVLDFYFRPKDYRSAEYLQFQLESQFECKRHPSKTV